MFKGKTAVGAGCLISTDNTCPVSYAHVLDEVKSKEELFINDKYI